MSGESRCPDGPCAGASHITYDGYDYRLVEIGTQCWYQENVRQLPAGFSPAQTFPTMSRLGLRLRRHRLYNHGRPSGWNLPTLFDTLGGPAPALKATSWDGTNAVGFEALQSGQRNLYTFLNGLNDAYYWTSTTGDFPVYAFAALSSKRRLWAWVLRGITTASPSVASYRVHQRRCVQCRRGCNDPSACNFNGADICDLTCIYPLVGEDCSTTECNSSNGLGDFDNCVALSVC